jgi:hypothetical protein
MPFTPIVRGPVGRTCSSGKRMRHAPRVAMTSSRVAVGDAGGEELIALLDLDADDALLAVVLVLDEAVFLIWPPFVIVTTKSCRRRPGTG